MPAADVVFSGGVVVKGNGYTGDVTDYVLELLQGSGGSFGLWNQTIPLFDDYASLVAAFPSPTVLGTPPLCRVWGTGDDVAVFYTYSASAAVWVQTAGPDDLRDGTSIGSASPITNPGDTIGVTNGLTFTSDIQPRRIHVDFGALVNFGATGDIVDVTLRRDGSAVRSSRVSSGVGAPLSGTAGYGFTLASGTTTTLQVVIVKVGGTGACTSTSNALLTFLQADSSRT